MKPEVERLARFGWPVLAGVLLGLAVGGIWTLAQPDRFRAEARVLLRGPAARGAVPAVDALAESSLLEQNVAQTLRLSEPPTVSSDPGQGGVLSLSVEAGSEERARQIDAEAAQVLGQLVQARFGPARLEVTLLDPAHVEEQTSPTLGRNLLIGGLGGLVAGVAAAVALAWRRPPQPAGAVDPAQERRLRKRVDEVAKRERALARRAGELAAREKQLEGREAEVGTQPPALLAPPEPEPIEEPEPEAPPPPQPVQIGAGAWNLRALEVLVRDSDSADSAQRDEWNTYLFFLREHAGPDGTLPPSFDGLINDVFAELVERHAASDR